MGRLYIGVGILFLALIFGGIAWFNRLIAVLGIALMLMTSSILYHRYLTAPACNSDDVTLSVVEETSDKFPNGGLNIRSVHQVNGWLFSPRRTCEMEVAPMIALSLDSNTKWTKIEYFISKTMFDDNFSIKSYIIGSPVDHSITKKLNY